MIGGESIRQTVPILRPPIVDIDVQDSPWMDLTSLSADQSQRYFSTNSIGRQREMSEIALGVGDCSRSFPT